MNKISTSRVQRSEYYGEYWFGAQLNGNCPHCGVGIYWRLPSYIEAAGGTESCRHCNEVYDIGVPTELPVVSESQALSIFPALPVDISARLISAGCTSAHDLRLRSKYQLSTIPGLTPEILKQIRQVYGSYYFTSGLQTQACNLDFSVTTIPVDRKTLHNDEHKMSWQIEQCDASDKPEIALIKYLEAQKCRGLFDEGFWIHMCLNRVLTYAADIVCTRRRIDFVPSPPNEFGHRQLPCVRDSSGELFNEYLETAGQLDSTDLLAAVAPVLTDENYRTVPRYATCPGIRGQLWKALGIDAFRGILVREFPLRAPSGPGPSGCFSWPDLTVLDASGVLRFIEVKTTDSLSENQYRTVVGVLNSLGLSYTVYKLDVRR